jgi:GDP-D-mannose dehydratase
MQENKIALISRINDQDGLYLAELTLVLLDNKYKKNKI